MVWAKRKDMTWLRLMEGPGDQVIIPVAPAMSRLTYLGERYNWMPMTQTSWREGEDRGEHSERGGAYLWSGWWASIQPPESWKRPHP